MTGRFPALELPLTFMLLVLSLSGFVSSRENDRLTMGGLWLGASLEELMNEGLIKSVEKSTLLPGGLVGIVSDDYIAHFLNCKSQVLAGMSLESGSEVVLREGFTRQQVLETANRLGWVKEKEWPSYVDVAQHHYRVLRFQVSEGVFALVILFRSDFTPDKPETVDEIFLRTDQVRGPYGDDKE
jgi:hypothetical protein